MGINQFERERVFDPIQRILHGWIGGAVLALVSLGWMQLFADIGPLKIALKSVHIALGNVLSLGLGLRVIWEFIRRKRIGWAAKRIQRQYFSEQEHEHRRKARAAHLLFYANLVVSVLSGWLLAGMKYDKGPFAEAFFDEMQWHNLSLQLHSVSLYGASAFILIHIFGLIWHEKKFGIPVAQAMVSGYRYRKLIKDEETQ